MPDTYNRPWMELPALPPVTLGTPEEERKWAHLKAEAFDAWCKPYEAPKLGTLKPHPQSYRPDLPLWSEWSDKRESTVRASKEERAQLSMRLLRVRLASTRETLELDVARAERRLRAIKLSAYAKRPELTREQAKTQIRDAKALLRQHDKLVARAPELNLSLEITDPTAFHRQLQRDLKALDKAGSANA